MAGALDARIREDVSVRTAASPVDAPTTAQGPALAQARTLRRQREDGGMAGLLSRTDLVRVCWRHFYATAGAVANARASSKTITTHKDHRS